MKRLNIHAFLLYSVMAMTPWQAAQAQSAEAVSASDSNGGLEDNVVTARKRQESLQDIGSAVSALSPSELLHRPDIDLSSFANAAPSVVITDMQEGPSSPASMTIRGIGQQTLFVNAATARLQELELEITARSNPAFTLTTSLGYLDAGFRRFLDPLTGDSLPSLKLHRAPFTYGVSVTQKS